MFLFVEVSGGVDITRAEEWHGKVYRSTSVVWRGAQSGSGTGQDTKRAVMHAAALD